MTEEERAYLSLFGPDTYGLEIPYALAKRMEAKGWVSWLPPVFDTRQYEITQRGRQALCVSSVPLWLANATPEPPTTKTVTASASWPT